MEYTLQVEKKQKFMTFIWSVVIVVCMMLFSWMFLGIVGYILIVGLLFFIIFSPIFYARFKLFLFIWIFIVPLVELQRIFMLGGLNPMTYFITGLTFPFAIFLIFNKLHEVQKELPFVKLLVFFNILILINIVRPGSGIMDIFNAFKFHFIELFIIFATYFYYKKEKIDTLFKWLGIFAFANSFVALVQRTLGVGLSVLEGIPRVRGIVGHPGSCGFLINVCFPLLVYLFLKEENKKWKWFWGIAIFLNFIALVLTLTKIAYLSFFITLLIIYSTLNHKLRFQIFGFSTVVFLLGVVLNFALGLNIHAQIAERFSSRSSLDWRYETWGYLLNSMDYFTLLLGNGIESSSYYLYKVTGFPSMAHNVYLELLYEYGIWGLSYLLAIFYIAKEFAAKIIGELKQGNSAFRMEYLVPLLVIIAIFVDAISDNSTQVRAPMYCSWMIITAFYLKMRSEKDLKKKEYYAG